MASPLFETVARASRWCGFCTGCLTLILGLVHVFSSDARIDWPNNFIDDTNKASWRMALFSFTPDVFIDIWTPTVFGLVAVSLHFTSFRNDLIASNWLRYFAFNFVMALFGIIGYVGGLGIIFSVPGFITCLLSLVLGFYHDGPACLDLGLNRGSVTLPESA